MNRTETLYNVPEEVILIIDEFLWNVKLGGRNKWENAIFRYLENRDCHADSIKMANIEALHGRPSISVLASQERGVEYTIE